MKDIYFAGVLFAVMLGAYLFTQDPNKLKVLELLMTSAFGAAVALLQARARSTQSGDVVEQKVVTEEKKK